MLPSPQQSFRASFSSLFSRPVRNFTVLVLSHCSHSVIFSQEFFCEKALFFFLTVRSSLDLLLKGCFIEVTKKMFHIPLSSLGDSFGFGSRFWGIFRWDFCLQWNFVYAAHTTENKLNSNRNSTSHSVTEQFSLQLLSTDFYSPYNNCWQRGLWMIQSNWDTVSGRRCCC